MYFCLNLTLGNFPSSFMSCNDDFKNMKIAWELHHEIKNSKNLIPWFSTFHYARRLQKSHLWSAWILLEYYIAHCTMMRFFKTFIVEHGKAKNLFMSSCTLFWDVILGWYHEILGLKFIIIYFFNWQTEKNLFWTNKKFVYLNIITNFCDIVPN